MDSTAAGYFVLHNGTNRDLKLVGAAQVGLHRNVEQQGMQGMARVTSVKAPARAEMEFKPGSYHLMLMQAAHKPAVGGTERITLRFADGTQIPVDFSVRGAAGAQK